MKFLAALFGIMLLIAGGTYLVFRHGSLLECADEPREELPSPDGTAVATRYERICGSGSAATHVGLRRRDAPFAPPDPMGEVYVVPGRPPLKIQWDGPRALRIEAPEPSAMPDRPQWRNVRVRILVAR